MTLKIFTQPTCPACPRAEELGKKLENKIEVKYFDVAKEKGLKEAIKYNVLATPTLILLDEKGLVKKTWVGSPDEEEVLKTIK